jgi:fermentation-respiration switch protein FrsA (DUF1100 family)
MASMGHLRRQLVTRLGLGTVALAVVAAACAGGAGTVAGPHGPATTAAVTPSPSSTSTPRRPVVATSREVQRLELTFVDRSRRTPARPPEAATATRVLRTSVWLPPGRGPWPLLVFGHGFDAQVATYAVLLDELARAGFVVAAPELPGSSSALAGTPDERDLDQQPCDLLFVAGEVERTAALTGLVSRGAVVMAGQSDGATAAAFAALTEPVGACGGPPVAGVVAYSVDPVPVRAGASAPVLAITGTADQVNPLGHTEALYEAAPRPAFLLLSAGDGHLAPSTDSPHARAIATVVVDFLDATLREERDAWSRLVADARAPGLSLERR